jgi:hypothetical protein
MNGSAAGSTKLPHLPSAPQSAQSPGVSECRSTWKTALGSAAAFVVAGPGIAACFVTLVVLRAPQPIRLGIQQCVQRCSSTLPRTTRSRWFLIRSSSIVMTFSSGLGVVSFMAATSSARFGAATQLCETFSTSSADPAAPDSNPGSARHASRRRRHMYRRDVAPLN